MWAAGTVPGGRGDLVQCRWLCCCSFQAFLRAAVALGRAVDVLIETASVRAGTLSMPSSIDVLGRCVLHC